MGKGNKSAQAPTTQTVTQTNIPKEFMPYFSRLMGRVEEQSLQPYEAYGGPRLAASEDFADIGASRDMTRGIAGTGITGLPLAQAAAAGNILEARRLGEYGPGQFTEFDFGPARQFTGEEAQQYMSPYMENVLDVQKASAIEDFDRLRGSRNARAVQAGAFGGSRQGVQEALAEEALMKQMGQIDATGRQAAFEQAAQMFGTDRAAQMAQQQAQAGELQRVQTGTEASRQFGAGQGLAALGAAGTEAGRLVALGEQERASQIQNAQLLEAIGRAQQGEAQAGLDIGYQDFLRQQGYPQEQLGFYSDVLRGLPVAAASTQNQQGYQSYNPTQQALGAGLSALSLYKAFA
jgi:hypothetical protein